MIVVIDTNVLISAVMKDSAKRRILLLSGMEFVCPEAIVRELRKHKQEILDKSRMTVHDFDSVLERILENVALIPDRDIEAHRTEAEKIMSRIDFSDAPFIAAALGIPDSIIWSDDRHFERQKKVAVVKTEQLFRMFYKA
jgi:predicted nucleic acid-binding protein